MEEATSNNNIRVSESAARSERARSGLAAARARGQRLGRPRKLTPAVIARAQELRAAGMTLLKIAKELNISIASASSACRPKSPAADPQGTPGGHGAPPKRDAASQKAAGGGRGQTRPGGSSNATRGRLWRF